MREFTVFTEQEEDGIYVASVPELPGCHTRAETLDELNRRIKKQSNSTLKLLPRKKKRDLISS